MFSFSFFTFPCGSAVAAPHVREVLLWADYCTSVALTLNGARVVRVRNVRPPRHDLAWWVILKNMRVSSKEAA